MFPSKIRANGAIIIKEPSFVFKHRKDYTAQPGKEQKMIQGLGFCELYHNRILLHVYFISFTCYLLVYRYAVSFCRFDMIIGYNAQEAVVFIDVLLAPVLAKLNLSISDGINAKITEEFAVPTLCKMARVENLALCK